MKLLNFENFLNESSTKKTTLKKVTNADIVDGKYIVPDGVTTLGDDCFYSCTALETIDLRGVTTLGDRCFYGCAALQSIDLKGVTMLGDGCFTSCRALELVRADRTPQLGKDVFLGCNKLVVQEDLARRWKTKEISKKFGI